jgi:hypothetical protein
MERRAVRIGAATTAVDLTPAVRQLVPFQS